MNGRRVVRLVDIYIFSGIPLSVQRFPFSCSQFAPVSRKKEKSQKLTGVLDEGEEDELGSVGSEGDKEDHVGGHHERDTIVTRISDGVHGVGSHLEDAIERQRLFDQEEKVAPVYTT